MTETPALGHILVIDEDSAIRDLLKVNLSSEGYMVSVEAIAKNVDHNALEGISMVIVDAMQQSYTGMDFIYDLKSNPTTEHISIILCSSVKSERIVIEALDAGADDFIVKPFSLRVLMARVKSVLRRHSIDRRAATVTSFHGLTVDHVSHTVKVDGVAVTLTKTEYSILALLLKNVDTIVSRVEIHRKVWDADDVGVNERIVDTNISRLRKKLGDIGQYIVSRSGHGYMLASVI